MAINPTRPGDATPSFGLNYQRSRAMVAFIGTKVEVINVNDVVSVRTTKTLAVPHGTFEIVLKAASEENYDEVGTKGMNQGRILDAHWFNTLQPMTLCMIAFGSERDLTQLTEFLTKKQGTEAIAKKTVTMLGYIETVSLGNEMTPSGPQRVVTVRGADLAKLFTLDSTYFFMNSAKNMWDRKVISGFDYVGNLNENPESGSDVGYTSAEAKALFNRIALIDDKDQIAFRQNLTDGKVFLSPIKAYQYLTKAAPSYQVRFKNGKTILDYMMNAKKEIIVAESLATKDLDRMRLFFQHWFQHTGPLWGLFTRFFPRPHLEFFMDTVGLEYHTVIRRPPFGRPELMQEADKVLKDFVTRIYTNFNEKEFSGWGSMFGTKDQFINEPLRLPTGKENEEYYTLEAADIISLNLTKGDQEVVTMYQTLTDPGFGGTTAKTPFTHPILADIPASKRFGLRFLQTRSPWISMEGMPDPSDKNEEPVRSANVFAIAQRETIYAYYYFRDNSAMLNGVATVRGSAMIRIGDRVVFRNMGKDLIGYVEGVTNAFVMGGSYVTQLTLSRIQPLNLTDVTNGRLVDYDTSQVSVKQGPETPPENPKTNTMSKDTGT